MEQDPRWGMDQGQAAVLAAAIGIPGVLLSGVLSYRAGRRQVRDQGVNEHLHWLRQQRQEHYVRFLQALQLCLKVLEEHTKPVVEATQAVEEGSLEVDSDDYQRLYSPPEVIEKLETLGDMREAIRMLGPEEIDKQADAVLRAVTLRWGSHNYLLNAHVTREAQNIEAAWENMADTSDATSETLRAFVQAARSVLTEPHG
ncbi:hypothetical protein ABZ330_31510 [Streptomyces sp. NPDC006172]|uniref:hypothetical protein n=1 Tax=Streptomyces sp. NPDC006172 TaxID=3154470 RepID=UPI0033CEED1A